MSRTFKDVRHNRFRRAHYRNGRIKYTRRGQLWFVKGRSIGKTAERRAHRKA